MKTFLYLFFLVFVFLNSFSQNTFKISSQKKVAKIPFTLVNNLIILKTKINNQDLNLVFDTGVRQTVLINMQNNDSLDYKKFSKITFRGLGNKNNQIVGLKSTGNHILIHNQIANIDATFFVVTNFDFQFSETMGVEINGFIGGELIKNHLVKIDYKNKWIYFYPPNSFSKKQLSKYREYPIQIISGKPYVNVQVAFNKNEKPQQINLLLDTGNSDALWIFKTKQISIPKNKKSIYDYMGLGFSGSIEGKRIKSYLFSFDSKFKFKNVYTALPDSIYFSKFSRNHINGMLGNEILRRFFIIFDYQNNKLYLKKYRYNYRQDFNFNDSGLYLAYKGKIPVRIKTLATSYKLIDNSTSNNHLIAFSSEYTYKFKLVDRIIVNYVRKDSPAEKAGLLKDDVLLKINGESIYQYRLDELDKKFFYKKSKKLYFLIERDGIQLAFRVNNKDPF